MLAVYENMYRIYQSFVMNNPSSRKSQDPRHESLVILASSSFLESILPSIQDLNLSILFSFLLGKYLSYSSMANPRGQRRSCLENFDVQYHARLASVTAQSNLHSFFLNP